MEGKDKVLFTLELRIASYVSIAMPSYAPSRDVTAEFSHCSYELRFVLRYDTQFCKRIYKLTTHGDVALHSEVQDTLHYVALRM